MTEQLAIDFERARARRDDGIERAVDHAEAVRAGWKKRARGYLLEYIAMHGRDAEFLAEAVREWAEVRGMDAPPDARAWGHVFIAAKREKVIKGVGVERAKSSNLSYKVLWAPA